MNLTRQEALEQLNAWTTNPSLLKHARAVEIVMREAAGKYGPQAADADTWGVVGLLHDADYERWPQSHPEETVKWLRGRDWGQRMTSDRVLHKESGREEPTSWPRELRP